MIQAKPASYFGREVQQERLQRFLAYGLPLAPEPASAFTDWSVRAGAGPDLIDIIIDALPEAGDAEHYGDGAGVISNIGWAFGTASGVLGTAAPGTYTVSVPGAGGNAVAIFAITQAGAGADASLPFAGGLGGVWPLSGVWPTSGVWPL